ncbi:MAG TPA: choice-of-anchor Q domain-containing protein, partial [Acidimicrobiales bacterium]|nr:choice-of-anchor Q domain-containing protein [Acidimicrobiales bacterium]
MAIVAATVGAGLGVSLFAPAVAGAATPFTVNDAGDYGLAAPGTQTTCTSSHVVDESNTCTLRAAIEASNNLGADTTITLPDPTTLTPLNAPAYVLDDATLGQLLISDSGGTVDIEGAGQNVVTIEANATFGLATTRVLKVNTGDTAIIHGVTIQNGNSSASGEVGGGILNCGTLTLSDSTVTNNETNAGPGGGIYGELGTTILDSDTVSNNSGADFGAGIYAEGGTMTLDGTQVSDNGSNATDAGGGIFIDSQSEGATAFTMEDESSVINNRSDGDGAGIEIDGSGNASTVVDIDGSTINGNSNIDGNGGGLAQDVDSTLTITDSVIDGNAASSDGGGLYLNADSTSVDKLSNDTIGDTGEGEANSASKGGGVFISQIDPTFTDVNVNGNNATGDGAGVYINDGTSSFTGGSISNNTLTGDEGSGGGVFIGNGTNTFSGVSILSNVAQNGGSGGGVYISLGTNSFTNTTVNGNQAIWASGTDGAGGGMYFDNGTNTFTGGSIDSNSAYEGGGAFLYNGTETFTRADISSNTATESGAGLFIFVENIDTPTTITASTISHNTIPTPAIGVTSFVGDGAGILADGCNQINLTNDTIASNTASILGGGYFGGNCFFNTAGPNKPGAKPTTSAATSHVVAPPTTNFLFDTIDANTSGSGGGNINTSDESILNAAETIVADGVSGEVVGTNCTFGDGGTLTSGGYNLIDDTTCGTPATGDIIGQPAQLGALANNGGPTNTEVPASTSPAVGGVPAGVCSGTGITTDQRGNARGAGTGGSCTIGAVEVAVSPFNPNGYRLVANEGGIFDFGLNYDGSLAGTHLNAPIVGIANAPGPNGYLMAGADGGVFSLGGAAFFGSLGNQTIAS